MAEESKMAAQSGRFTTEEKGTVNLADILGNTIRTGSIVGTLTVGIAATALRIGAADLENRHTVQVINTGAATIYIGFDTGVTVASGIPCEAGAERSFALDPNDPLTLYAISTAANAIRLVEVK